MIMAGRYLPEDKENSSTLPHFNTVLGCDEEIKRQREDAAMRTNLDEYMQYACTGWHQP